MTSSIKLVTCKTQYINLIENSPLILDFQVKCENFNGLGNRANLGATNVDENLLQHDRPPITPMPSCVGCYIYPIVLLQNTNSNANINANANFNANASSSANTNSITNANS
jgi:hypothetical protein